VVPTLGRESTGPSALYQRGGMGRVDSGHLSDLVDAVGGFPYDTELVEILLRRADRLLAKDGGRDCQRVLTDTRGAT